MRTLFTTGLRRDTTWLGQIPVAPRQQTVYAATFGDIVAQGLTEGVKAYGTYGSMEVAQEVQEGKRAEAEAAAAAARTAAINQQTSLIQQQATAKQNQIMGIDKSAFFIGALMLGLLTVGGALVLLSKK